MTSLHPRLIRLMINVLIFFLILQLCVVFNTNAATTASPVLPTGNMSKIPTSYEWNADANALWYAVVVRDEIGGFPIYQGLSPEDADCGDGTGKCHYSTTTQIYAGIYDWWVRVWVPGNDEEWSNGQSFQLAEQFDAQPITPSGDIQTAPTEYRWQADSNALWYAVVVKDSSGQVPIYSGLSPEEAGCADGINECSFTTTDAVTSGEGEWWVRTWVPSNDSKWSSVQSFNLLGAGLEMPTSTTAVPISPGGDIIGSPEIFMWQADPNVIWYAVFVKDPNGQFPIMLSLSPEEAGCADGSGTCEAMTAIPLEFGASEWWVRAWMPNNEPFWSSGLIFNLETTEENEPEPACIGGALWSDPTSWPDHVPTDGETVTIPEGTHIILNTDTASIAGLTIDGTLTFCDLDVNLTADWILVRGELHIGSESAPFTHQATITLTGNDPNNGIMGMSTRGIMVMGGTLELHGTPPVPVWTKINDNVDVGDTFITLSEPTNWSVTNEIVLAPTDFYGISESENYQIATEVNENGFYVNNPANSFRWGLMQYVTDSGMSLNPNESVTPPAPPQDGFTPLQLDERAEVGNLTRNIVIQGADDALWQNDRFGAHVMVMMLASAVHVDGVEFRRVGQAGELGRYPFHWHRLSYDNLGNELGDATGHYLRNSSIHDSSNRAVTIHGTNGVQVQNNICYDILGHAIYFEDAVERRNVVEGNLVLRVRFPQPENALKLHDISVQFGHTTGASGIWVSNPDNTVRNNTLADAEGFGMWMAFPQSPVGPSANVPILPFRLRFGNFDDNTMHSNQFRGVMFDDSEIDNEGTVASLQYASTSDGQNSYDNLERFTISGWVLWKNGGGNFWNRVVWPTYEEFVSADGEGKYFSGSGSEGLITRSLMIASSLNNLSPPPNPVFGPSVAFATYHSAFDIRNNIVINFPLVEDQTSGAFATDDYYIRPVEKGQIRNTNNLLINSHPGYRSDASINEEIAFNFSQGFFYYVFAGAVWDPHGTWGPSENWSVYDIPFLTHNADCSTIEPASQEVTSCDGEYYGVNHFVLDQGNLPWDDLMAIDVTRYDDSNPDVVVGNWHVDGAQPGWALAHTRHFAARQNGIYRLDFPESTIPSDVAVDISNMHDPAESFVLGIRFSGSEGAQVYSTTYTYPGYFNDSAANSPSWASKHNFTEVANRQAVIDGTGEIYWQDHINNIVWINVTAGNLVQFIQDDGGEFSDANLYNEFHLRIW